MTTRSPSATPLSHATSGVTGLYVHIPFCHLRCAFCAFYLQLHTEAEVATFLQSLRAEISWYAQHISFPARAIQTIYLGGGTPTTLHAEQLTDILDQLRATFSVSPQAEITVEGHPETVSLAQLRALKDAGVTRLSLGAESLNAHELLRVGRPADATGPHRAVALAREAGFHNVNLDLMYDLPGQTLASWTTTLEGIVALHPTHISCYALTVEPGTALAHTVSQGTRPAPDPDRQRQFELAAEAHLARAGYHRYELSNYARPGWECQHNRLYWEGGHYLGLGPSAESYLDGVRFGNVADLSRYASALRQGDSPVDHREPLTPLQQDREALVFGLRQLEGVDRTLVERLSADRLWRSKLDELIADGLVDLSERGLRLTPKGRHLADSVAVELM